LPDNPGGKESSFRAVAGERQSVGRTAGEVLDALPAFREKLIMDPTDRDLRIGCIAITVGLLFMFVVSVATTLLVAWLEPGPL